MKKAIIDIDGVLNYYPETFINFVNDNYGYNFNTLKQIKETIPYDTYKEYKQKYRQSHYKNEAQLRIGALELINYLKENGYLIYIVTARPLFKYNLLENTIKWLKSRGIQYDYIYCSQKKDFTIYEKFGHVDFVIDDNVDNLHRIARINGLDDCEYANVVNEDNKDINCYFDRFTDLNDVKKLILRK